MACRAKRPRLLCLALRTRWGAPPEHALLSASEKTMSIECQHDLDGPREVGRIVSTALDEMKRHTRPGLAKHAPNEIGAVVLRKNQARSAPMLVYGFPAEICIGVNDRIVHGIPCSHMKADRVRRCHNSAKPHKVLTQLTED
jgi:methionine aminopeptidase